VDRGRLEYLHRQVHPGKYRSIALQEIGTSSGRLQHPDFESVWLDGFMVIEAGPDRQFPIDLIGLHPLDP
jgi:hypothetical protein